MGERGWLLISASASGATGQGILGYGARNGMIGWVHSAVTSSANSASLGATLYASMHPDMPLFPVTAWAFLGAANSGTAILSANYGHIEARVNWVSGAGTGRVTMFGQWADR
jgi:hypothetical protein